LLSENHRAENKKQEFDDNIEIKRPLSNKSILEE
jgi:hypothetical protein